MPRVRSATSAEHEAATPHKLVPQCFLHGINCERPVKRVINSNFMGSSTADLFMVH